MGVLFMNVGVKIGNKLHERLEELGMSQKNLAEAINEREASISDFINLKRGSLNVGLIAKIATALKFESVSDLLEFKEVICSDNYIQNKWYELSEYMSFAYIYNSNELYFEVAEATESSILLHNRYLISDRNKDDINNEFAKLGIKEEFDLKDELTSKFISLCRFNGEVVSAHRYKDRESAREVLYMLY